MHVYGLASKELFSPAKSLGAQHSRPQRLVGKASGRFQCLPGPEPAVKGSYSLHPPPAESSSQHAPRSLCAPSRSLAGRFRQRESSKGGRTCSVPPPETQQSTRGLPDLFQTGLAPAELLSPGAREHKPIKPHTSGAPPASGSAGITRPSWVGSSEQRLPDPGGPRPARALPSTGSLGTAPTGRAG